MNIRKPHFSVVGAIVLTAAGLLSVPDSVYAAEQGEQRREGRDVRQETRQDARSDKQDCRAENNKNNAECRQDKRGEKQEGRENARNIKY